MIYSYTMSQMTRRKVVGSIVTGVAVLGAGCSGTTLNTSSGSGGQKDREFEYVKSTESTVIGKNETSEPAVVISLTDFAVSKHSAATDIQVQNGDNAVGESTITDSKSLTIPLSKDEFNKIKITDDNDNTLSEYSPD